MRILCSICADNIEEDLCSTRCAHTFHFECLNQWLVHSKTCPQCRNSCRPKEVLKLFVTSSGEGHDVECTDPKEMKEILLQQKKQIEEKNDSLMKAETLLEDIQQEMVSLKSQYDKVFKKLKEEESSKSLLRKRLKSQTLELEKARIHLKEAEKLKSEVENSRRVQALLKAKKDEAQDLIRGSSASQLAVLTVALKAEYDILKEKRTSMQKENERLKYTLNCTKKELTEKESELKSFQEDLILTEQERESLQRKVKMLQAAVDSPGSRQALKRMLESPMPELRVEKPLTDIGASPLLSSGPPPGVCANSKPSGRHHMAGVKRTHCSKENVVFPVPKMKKSGLSIAENPTSSSHNYKLKFAPRNCFLIKK